MSTNPTLPDIINDPDIHSKFRLLPPEEQTKFLGAVSPEYTKLPAVEQESFRNKFLDHGNVITAPPAPNAILQNQFPTYLDPLQNANTGFNQIKQAWSDIKPAAVNAVSHPLATIGGAFKNVASSVPGIIGSIAGDVSRPDLSIPQKIGDTASLLAGGDPAAARQALAQGDLGQSEWEGYGKPVAGTLASEAIARAPGAAKELFSGPAARTQNRSFADMIAAGIPQRGGDLPTDVAQRILPLYQQAAKNVGVKNRGGLIGKMFTSDMPTRNLFTDTDSLGKVLKSTPKALDVANEAVNIADKPLATVMKVAGAADIDPEVKNNIIKQLEADRDSYTKLNKDSSSINAINSQIKAVEDAKTYGDLNDLKKRSNNIIEGMFTGNPSKDAQVTGEPIWTYKKLGDHIRQNMYPAVQDYAGANFNLSELGQREADAMNARDGIYRNYYKMGGAEASADAKNYFEKAVDEGSLYKTHVVRKLALINPTPAGQFNKYFRRGLGELGEGGSPESVNIVQNKQPLQLQAPPGSQPFQFDIPTGIAQEGTQGSSGVAPIKQYAGQVQVPRPVQNPADLPQMPIGTSPENYNPISGPSYFQQRQELGSTADTIPTLARGTQSGARVAADQVGMGHTPNAAAQQENFNNWKSDFQNAYGKPPSAQDIGLYQQTHANIPNAYPRATMPGLTGEIPSTRQQAFTGSPTVSKSNFQSLTGTSEPTQTVTNNGVGILKTGDPEIARTHLNNAVNKMMNQDFFGLAADKQQGVIDQIHDVKSIKDIQKLEDNPYLKSTFNKMSDDQKLRFVQDFNNLDQQLGKYNLGQGLRGGSPVSVKWTPADLGTTPQKGTGATKRVASNAARVILSPPPKENK